MNNNPFDLDKQKVKFNQSVNVKYESNPTISTSLNSSDSLINNKKLSINKLSTNRTINQSSIKPLKSSSLINQLKLFKQNKPISELNKISAHNQQQQAKKMRTITTAVSEKNAEFKSKYGLNKNASNTSTSLINKPAKTKSGTVVDEKLTVSHKGTFDSGPILASTTINKSRDKYKLPYGKGENIETDEFGEQIWKHKNVRAYEEKTKRKVRQEFDVPASAVVKKLNESTKLDKNNNEQHLANKSSAQKKYMYGMNSSGLSGGGLKEINKSNTAVNNKSQAVVLHSTANYSNINNNNSLNHLPFKDTNTTVAKLNSNGVFMVDKSIQCELKKSKLSKERFSETGWKHYVEEPEEPKFREFSNDKWYYDKYEFEPGEILPESRQVDGIGAYHQVNKWTKKIPSSSLEQKVETERKENTEYKHNFSGSFKVIKPDKNGYVTTYSSSKPANKNLGHNSAGQHVISSNKSGEVIYSQVDKSKKRILRDQLHTPLPGYDSDEIEDEELNLRKTYDERPRSALKNATDKYRLSSRSPSPVSRNKMIYLNIPTEKQKSKLTRERSLSPHLISSTDNTHRHLLSTPARSSSTAGDRLIRNRVYHFGNTSAEPIEPPPQFATLNHKLPPKAPAALHRHPSNSHQQIRRIPIESDSKLYYHTEQSNYSDQSSVFDVKKNHETLEETISFVSSGSEFGIEKEQQRLNSRIADSTIRELDKKKKQISYDNQVTRHHSVNETPVANSIWYKSLDEDYRKGMASNDICLPSLNYSSNTMSKLEKNKSKSEKLAKEERQAFTLDKNYLKERKKSSGLLSTDNRQTKNSLISRRPTQQASDFLDNKMIRSRQFNSASNLAQTNQFENQKRSSSLTRRFNESELSDASITSNKGVNLRNAYRGLNYPLKPVTRSASMHTSNMINHPSLVRKHSSNVIRSTESDHGYQVRPLSRASATSRFSSSGRNIIENEPVVLYLPAIDNTNQINTGSNKLVNNNKSNNNNNNKLTIGNKKLASSVNNLSSVSRSNSILAKLKTPSANTSSKKELSKSSDKLNEITTKLNNYQNSKTLAGKMKKSDKKELKRSKSMDAKLPLFQKLKNKLKSKESN